MNAACRMVRRGLSLLGLLRGQDPCRAAAGLLRGVRVTDVVDGGAHTGGTTRRLLALFPAATVHAFEPQRQSFARLQSHFKNHPRVRPYPWALSDRSGPATLHVHPGGYTTSLLMTSDPERMHPQETQEVETRTLDAWAVANGQASPALLKLDVQGHELAALRGASQLLAREVRVVLTEVNFHPRYCGSCVFPEVVAFLHERGFRLIGCYEIVKNRRGAWWHGDALFARDSVTDSVTG
jgi:FkbM family methyltransferase